MSEKEADFITIVSSEMIAEVMEEYFNRHMYKKKVEIVDLKSTETGYMFSLAFVHVPVQSVGVSVDRESVLQRQEADVIIDPTLFKAYEVQSGEGKVRGKNGQFVSKEKVKG